MIRIWGYVLLTLMSRAIATPGISFPINSQIPPVAKVLTPFSFTFAATSFSTNSPPLVYTLADAPAWLQLDSENRVFSGTPGAGDVGAKAFKLVASDGSGSSTLPVTFIISADPGPGLGEPLSQQLSAFGPISASQSLVLYPSQPLSISFSHDTFTNTDGQTNYYAACVNNTPLPSWINFNPKDLSFTGITPAFTSPSELPQDFGIELTASNVAGFSGAVATFHIIISEHILAFDTSSLEIEFVSGQSLNFTGLKGHLELDGKPVQASAIKSVSGDYPNWLAVDPQNLQLTGTPPLSTTPFQLVISVTDIYEDTASVSLILSTNSTSPLISGVIGGADVTAGTQFSYSLDRYLFPVPNTKVTVDLGLAASWLSFDANSLTLQGKAPADLKAQKIVLNVTASSTWDSESQALTLMVIQELASSTSTSFSPTADLTSSLSSSPATVSPTTQPIASEDVGDGAKAKDIAAKIVLPLAALFLGGGLLAFWCHRRKKQAGQRRRQRTSSQSSIAAWKKKISRPFFIEEPVPEGIEEKRVVHHERVPSTAPVLPEIVGVRGIFRNSTQLGRPHQESKRESKRESRSNVSRGLSVLHSMSLFARGGRHEESTNFTMVEQEAGRAKGTTAVRGRSGSNLFSRPPNGIGHGMAPTGSVPNFDSKSRLSVLSRGVSQPVHGLGHGKGISPPFGPSAGHEKMARPLHTGSSDGSYPVNGSSSSSSGPAFKDFPKPPEATVKLVSNSSTYSRSSRAYPRSLYPSGPATSEKGGRGAKVATNNQNSSDSSSANQSESGKSLGQGPSTGDLLMNRSRPTSSWYSQKTLSNCTLDAVEVPPLPPLSNARLRPSPSTKFLRKYLPGPLRPKASRLTVRSGSDFANPVESEDEIGVEQNPIPANVLTVPTHTIYQSGSMDRLPPHPGPLTAHGVSTIRTWRSSRDLHQTMTGARSASDSSGQSSAGSAGSSGHGETHEIGIGEVARRVSVESSIRRNRPVSRSMRAEREEGYQFEGAAFL